MFPVQAVYPLYATNFGPLSLYIVRTTVRYVFHIFTLFWFIISDTEEYLQKSVNLLYNMSKEYNLEIARKKMKLFGSVGTDHLRTKIIINDETLEQVSQFTYLGCSISFQFSNDVEFLIINIFTINR